MGLNLGINCTKLKTLEIVSTVCCYIRQVRYKNKIDKESANEQQAK